MRIIQNWVEVFTNNQKILSISILFIYNLRVNKNYYNNYQTQFLICILALFLIGLLHFYLKLGLVSLTIDLAICEAISIAGGVIISLFK